MKLDMHIHSWYSYHPFWGHDSWSRPEDIIKMAIKRGLDGISVTDHNTLKGSRAMLKAARGMKSNFIVVPGMEIKSTSGDILAYGIGEEVPRGLSPEETIERILEQGGFPVIAHPFPGLYGLINKSRWDEKAITALSARFKKRIGVEVLNAGNSNAGDGKALALAEKLGLPMTAGSDSHIPKSIGMAGIICDSDPLEAIRKGRIKIFGEHYPITVPIRVYMTKVWKLFI